MAVTMGMFIFEVVVEKVNSLVASRHLVIKSEFADVFSLELKDPKQMYIVMPEPPPLPPDPPGKKKKPPKPKKSKKGAVVLPPPEPKIQSGQSVLFSSSAEFLIQNMNKCPLVISLWSKEDNLSYIGSNSIPWDPKFLEYLQKVSDCQIPTPVTLAEEYNIFEEGKGKMMAKIEMQVKLTFMTEKITTSFRTLSEDPSIKKFLYTGMNSKTTSYLCTMKTTDEDFEANCNKIENSYIVDKPKANKVVYADYKNAPGANLGFFKEGDYCCMSHADKPPESIYKSPETCPDINFIIDYVRKIIVSCNDNMRMLTPRPTISPRIKATDIDRLCYCRETAWPKGELAERFKKEALSEPCPICIDTGKMVKGARGATFDIANIRGPCGKPECRIARAMRAYIENLVDEDNVEFDIDDIIGPCGSKVCTLATKIQEFLRHEGAFTEGAVLPALSTRCACLEKMQEQLTKREECVSICSKDCEDAETDDSTCEGMACPFNSKKVYDVYYFTVEHDFDKKSTNEPSEDDAPSSSYKYCASTCPSVRASQTATCSKTMCSSLSTKDDLIKNDSDSKCQEPVCPDKRPSKPSPADSNIEIDFDTIRNPCCVKSCDVAEKVKDFIADSVMGNKRRLKCMALEDTDPCYCNCVCSFKFSRKTTYCSVCGGYQCLGDDIRDLPDHQKPHPCPIYHKMYDRNRIKTKSPWPEETKAEPRKDAASGKSSRAASKSFERPGLSAKAPEKEIGPQEKTKKATAPKKKASKFTNNVITETSSLQAEKKPDNKYRYPPVPKNMGWNWTAEDIPGMKPRPQWRPGAANKILVRRYRAIREGMDVIAKKKRALMQRKNKIGMKPALIITKQNGEYTVQMEVFKKYSKERLLYQYPYEEKPPLIYTIGKTEEEKKKVQEKRDRKNRRDTRRKSKLLQSTFRDKCQEICLKAYNQAIGILPLPNPNDPECPCFTKTAESLTTSPADSCSCSDAGSIESSDTDNDEWVIEFSPPASKWDAKAKHPPVLSDNETQYTYLDYKVKLLDKSGNPVPRYFKGSDGRQECSDLGGFWGPGHVWLEINKDGYIGPDQRWVPLNFIGPDGMFYSAEEGNFTDSSGQLIKIGIDGYIDKDLKWVWYGKRKPIRGPNTKSSSPTVSKKVTKSPAGDAPQAKPGAKAKQTSVASSDNKNKKDKKVALASGASTGRKNPLVMSVSVNYMKNKLPRVPSTYPHRNKTYVNKKLAKYQDIMGSLQMYEDLDSFEDKPQHNQNKTNRAMNTINVEKPRRLDVLSPIINK